MQVFPLENEEQLQEIISAKDCRLILKHNTACSISNGVLDRLKAEAGTVNEVQAVYILDLLAHRDLSNAITGRFGVPHQSPQLLLIRDGRCIHHQWGFTISAEKAAKVAAGQ